MVNEGDKIRLKTGEIALISEVLGKGAAFVIELFNKDGHVSIEQILKEEIASVFVETEQPLAIA
jgi:hypothetical protein